MDDRERSPINNVISFGLFCLSPSGRLLKRESKPILLSNHALEIPLALVECAGAVVSRKELISRAWPDMVVNNANLRVHVSGLRRVLGDGREGVRYIANAPSRGCCFVAPVSCSTAQVASPDNQDCDA